MWKRYRAFLRTPPEVKLQWQDAETGARGWLVINSLRGGAAGGGTRMRPGVDPREVTYLAKAMDLKFALSGPAIGGAKAGIDFDPTDPRKTEVLERWYRTIRPYLQEHYGTGGDLNVDEVTDVIPAIGSLGLHHPQEGIVRGHFRPEDGRFRRIMDNLDRGVKAPVTGEYGIDGLRLTVSDVITGYGVARTIEHFYHRQGRSLDGVRVLLEGFGNVGASCGLYLARAGARLVAVRDAEKTLVDPAGIDRDEVESLVRRCRDKLLPADDHRIRRDPEAFWSQPADVFVAAALSGTVTPATLERMDAAGIRVIACGANQPFREVKLGSTRVQQEADRHFSILPDILANCGMARTFSYLMEEGARPEAGPIFSAVDETIATALDAVLDRNREGATNLLAATLAHALDAAGAA